MMHHRERSVSGPQHPLGILACLDGTIAKVLGKATTGTWCRILGDLEWLRHQSKATLHGNNVAVHGN